ncbi:MAG TPA: bifunctional nuclease domain-containing protein [Candidatus Binatia bacterium]|nr:bifunctional nuclease domain-containing protein [Candidatus Binatia bacterium]
MARALTALAAGLLLAVGTAEAKPVEVTVEGMLLDPTTGSPVVRLVEKGKAESAVAGRELPIWIGPFEAQAIALEMQGVPPPRPLTHDLMKQLVERLGAKVRRVVIADLRDNTYFATLHLEGPGGKELAVDARPSDAIALALRFHGPILVAEELFAKAAASRATPAAAHLWGVTVQDLTADVAAFFEAPAAGGVLVSDVEAAAPARELARGDIIIALDDQPIASVDELTTRAGSRTAPDPVRLSVRRAGRPLQIRFAVAAAE